MEENPDIAKDVGPFEPIKRNQKECWEVLAVELNCLGPAARDGKQGHKLKLKKKIASNRMEIVATGGGPYKELSLSPLENAVNDLLGLQHAANPDGKAFGGSIPMLPYSEKPVLEENSTKPKRVSHALNCDYTTSTTSQTLSQEDYLSATKCIEEFLAEIAR